MAAPAGKAGEAEAVDEAAVVVVVVVVGGTVLLSLHRTAYNNATSSPDPELSCLNCCPLITLSV